MKITLKNLLNFLPMDKEVRQRVLTKVDDFTPDQKLAMIKLCWRMFYELLKTQTDYEFRKKLIAVGEGKDHLKTQMYKEIEEKIYKKFLEDLRKGGEAAAIDEIREKIQETIKKQTTVSFPTPPPPGAQPPIAENA